MPSSVGTLKGGSQTPRTFRVPPVGFLVEGHNVLRLKAYDVPEPGSGAVRPLSIRYQPLELFVVVARERAAGSSRGESSPAAENAG